MACVLVLSCLLRLQMAREQPLPIIGTDARSYHDTALRVLDGTGTIGHFFNPGMSFFLVATYSLVGPDYKRGRVVLVLLGAALAFAVFKLTDHVIGRRAAWIAFLVASFDPFFSYFARTEWGEMPMFLLVTLSLWLSLSTAERPDLKKNLLLGATIAVSTLFKAWLFIFIPIHCAQILVSRGTASWKAAARETAVVTAVCFIILAPWIAHLYAETGHFVLSSTNGPFMFFYGNNPLAEAGYRSEKTLEIMKLLPDAGTTDPFALNRQMISYALNHIVTNPEAFLRKLAAYFFKYWSHPSRHWQQREWDQFEFTYAYLWIKWTLALIGAVFLLRQWRKHFALVAFFVVATAVYGLTSYLGRYKDILLPGQLVYFSAGVCVIWSRWRGIPKSGALGARPGETS